MEGEGWTSSRRILLFSFANSRDYLKLWLTVGPGPQEVRQQLFSMAQYPPFKPFRKTLTNKWLGIYQRSFLTPQSYEDMSDDELEMEIHKHWAAFLDNDLPKLDAVIKAQEWIWQPMSNTGNVVEGSDK